ncbi:hypothetical protein HYX14_02060 [Candidatus Woesearchaeota archaeon]|nr:hypothetical protein [Candidatus Woesearchaeota archaeon]
MINVDIHEPVDIIERLRKSIDVSVSNLTPGDYVLGNIAIERKTLSDFFQSLAQKRLFEQLSRLKSCYPVCFLILEVYDFAHIANYRAFYGAIIHIMLEMNIRILFTQNKEQTAEVILLLAGKASDSQYSLQHKRKEIRWTERKHQILEAIPNIGKKKADLLLKHFSAPSAVFTANEKELRKVIGIGKKTARNIKELLGEAQEKKS